MGWRNCERWVYVAVPSHFPHLFWAPFTPCLTHLLAWRGHAPVEREEWVSLCKQSFMCACMQKDTCIPYVCSIWADYGWCCRCQDKSVLIPVLQMETDRRKLLQRQLKGREQGIFSKTPTELCLCIDGMYDVPISVPRFGAEKRHSSL